MRWLWKEWKRQTDWSIGVMEYWSNGKINNWRGFPFLNPILQYSSTPVKNIRSALCLISLLLYLLSATCVLADDVGITKARLIQKSEKSYVVEADVTQALVWAIKQPIFPDRFQVSELEYITQSGWIIIQATATTEGEPLSPEDEILLPWMRNGAAISVQWLDGSLQQGLFLRSLEGIRVDMGVLMKSVKSLKEVCVDHFIAGLQHLSFKWIHVLFAGILVFLAPFPQVFRCLLYYFLFP